VGKVGPYTPALVSASMDMLHENPGILQSCFQQSLSQAQINQLGLFVGPEVRASMQAKVEEYAKIQVVCCRWHEARARSLCTCQVPNPFLNRLNPLFIPALHRLPRLARRRGGGGLLGAAEAEIPLRYLPRRTGRTSGAQLLAQLLRRLLLRHDRGRGAGGQQRRRACVSPLPLLQERDRVGE
jgi:hypothetical protein